MMVFEMDMDMDLFTPSPTPPLPVRNPDHRYSKRHPLPPLPDCGSKLELVPKPLDVKRTRDCAPPPQTLHVAVYDISFHSADNSHVPASPTRSVRSSSSSVSSSPPTSTPSSPRSRPRSLTYSFPPPDVAYWETTWDSLHMPRHSLRRKPSPKKESLRSLRAKESDACLQRVYDERLDAYLSGNLGQRVKWKDGLGCLDEE